MKLKQSFFVSPLGILLGGAALWYLAGVFTISISLETRDAVLSEAAAATASTAHVSGWLLLRAAAVWAICGGVASLVLVSRIRLAHQRYLAMPQLRTQNPFAATALVGVAFAVILGLLGGYALARWYLPVIGLPEGAILKASAGRYVAGACSTALACILTVPVGLATLRQVSGLRQATHKVAAGLGYAESGLIERKCTSCGEQFLEFRLMPTKRPAPGRALGGALCRSCGRFYCEPCVAKALQSVSGPREMQCQCKKSKARLDDYGQLALDNFKELVVFRTP